MSLGGYYPRRYYYDTFSSSNRDLLRQPHDTWNPAVVFMPHHPVALANLDEIDFGSDDEVEITMDGQWFPIQHPVPHPDMLPHPVPLPPIEDYYDQLEEVVPIVNDPEGYDYNIIDGEIVPVTNDWVDDDDTWYGGDPEVGGNVAFGEGVSRNIIPGDHRRGIITPLTNPEESDDEASIHLYDSDDDDIDTVDLPSIDFGGSDDDSIILDNENENPLDTEIIE